MDASGYSGVTVAGTIASLPDYAVGG